MDAVNSLAMDLKASKVTKLKMNRNRHKGSSSLMRHSRPPVMSFYPWQDSCLRWAVTTDGVEQRLEQL